MKRQILVLAATLALILSGCGRPERSNENLSAGVGQPVQGDWAIVRFEAEPDSLNPITSVTSVAHYALWGAKNSQVYELLMSYNSKDWDVTEPLLAEGPPLISEDRLIYTITVREGVKWHDGRPFTAEDVLFTFKATASPYTDAASLRSSLTDLADVQVEGRTIRFLMSKPNVFNERNVVTNSLAIIPKHVFDETGLLDGLSYKDIIDPVAKTNPKVKEFGNRFNSHPANRAPVGTGPYKFERWESGREIVLARNDEYWGKKAFLDKIVYRIITDHTAALTALKAGEIDLQPRLQPAQYNEQTSGPAFDEQFTKGKYSIPGRYQILWNNDRPFFNDKRVRQAMTMLVDREKVIEVFRFGLGQIAESAFHPQDKDHNTDLKPWPYDPKRAAQLLDQAGWKDHDGDGIRDKDGVKFKFEFLISNGSPLATQISTVLMEELRKAGIEMTERTIELALQTKTLREHRFDATAVGLSLDLVQDPFEAWHSSSSAGGFNFSNFKNAESDRLLEQARMEFDSGKRKAIYWRWQELVHEEQPVTFLYYPVEPAAYSKRFQDAQWLPLRPGYDLTAWWVPLARQKYNNGTALNE